MRKLFLTYCILLTAVVAFAQGTTVASGLPYECSFEESDILTGWTLNYNTPNATDKWMYGTAVHSEGRRSLYISSDGQNPVYGKNPNIVISYLRYNFPVSTKTQKYDVSFDWKGVGDRATSKLYVMFGLENEFLVDEGGKNLEEILSTPGARLSNAAAGECQLLGAACDTFLCGSETWQNVTFSNEVSINARNSSKTFMFVFIWVNGNTQDVSNTSIAIDNFQINSAAIKKPENVIVYPHCEDSTLIVTWETSGAANEFDIQFRKVGDTQWLRGMSGITEGPPDGYTREDGSQCSFALKRVLEGSYDVRIRSAYYDQESNTTLRSNYVYVSNVLVYCPENHCVNYIDLYSSNVTCTYGYHPEYRAGATPYDNIGVIDYGPDAQESRHTLHVDQTELDPRTDSLLKTVPEGALASVRLGNWAYSGEAESITYDILVDTFTQGILIVRYAIVFENPNGHPKKEEPAFQLDILNKDGNPIDLICGHADFTYSDAEGAVGWHMTADNKVAWKEWTTIGVNLLPYHNENIKVRFTTLDCGQGGHYAYAYFTVDCANAHIETESCGNDASITCIAPEGFNYEWRDENDSIYSTDQVFVPDAGLHTFTCKVSFIEQPDCYFEISTISAPRFPVSDYIYEPEYANCQSKLKFTNKSHVMNKFDGTEKHTSEPCNEARWVFRRLSDGVTRVTTSWSPTYVCPDEGDSIEVTLYSYIGANNSCDTMRRDTIVVPNIIPQNTEERYITCSENPVYFGGKWFNTDTVYVGVFPNFAGCDSLSTLYLTVLPEVKDTYRHDSICSDQSLVINGIPYNQPLENHLIMFQSVYGCDSAVYLTLTVNERLDATINAIPYACSDDEELYITMDIAAGVFDSLEINFSTPQLRDTVIYDPTISSIAIPYPDSILPGHYTATLKFYQFCCGTRTEYRDVEVRYSSSIVEQKWNDVLTLLSPQYNGGFEFTAFQWFKNGEQLEGETRSYLYQPLDTTAYYYVALTRPDGVIVTTCPIQPTVREQQTEYPSIVHVGQRIPVYREQPASIRYYTVSGQLYSAFDIASGYSTIEAPMVAGVYIIQTIDNQGESTSQKMIVQ